MRFKEFYLNEGINDKNIFKAIFLAGGPGSGKSFIAKKMFKGTGAKFVNSDDIFEKQLISKNIPLKIDDKDIEVYKKQMEIRKKSKSLTKSRANLFINGMLPLIIDGTGHDYNKIKKQKDALDLTGYDTYMIFVNTNLKVALDRNEQRERNLPENLVKRYWEDVQSNIGKFQSLFNSSNFFIIDNNDKLDMKEEIKLNLKLARKAMKILDKDLKNRIGNSIVKILKNTKGKTLNDIPVLSKVDFNI